MNTSYAIGCLAGTPAILLAQPADTAAAFNEMDVEFDGGAPEVTLAGTLSLPKAEHPAPAVVLVSGSGPQDRNETIFGKQPFRVIAEYLASQGIAVLRYDDRGFAQSSGDFASATTDDFALDAAAAIEYLKSRPEIDPESIAVIGHSEGGVVASLLAARGQIPTCAITLGGTYTDGGTILRDQTAALLDNASADEEQRAEILAAHDDLTNAIRNDASNDTILDRLSRLLSTQSYGAMTPEQTRPSAVLSMSQIASPWMKRFISLNPAKYAQRSDVPVLALFGSLDFQVSDELNAAPAREALADVAGSQVLVLEGKNHLFQDANTGMMDEYGRLDHTIAEDVLELMTDWLWGQFEG